MGLVEVGNGVEVCGVCMLVSVVGIYVVSLVPMTLSLSLLVLVDVSMVLVSESC